MGRKTVPVSSPPVRALIGTSGLHLGAEGSNGILAKTGSKECGLPRRFLPGQSTRSGPEEDVDNSLAPFQAGIRGQLEKFLDTSFSEGGVPGLHSGHRQFSGGAPSTQSGQDHGLLERKQCSVRTLASLIGKLQNASTAILPAPLHFRHMQMASIRALARQQQNYAASLELPEAVLAELRWWLRNLRTWNGKSFLNPDPHLDVVITSDDESPRLGGRMPGSSDSGALATVRDGPAYQCARVAGRQVGFEILQGSMARRSCPAQAGQHDSCLTDCEDGLSPVKRCLIVTQEIWEFVLSSGSTVTAQHLPGKDNEIADFQSRVFRDSSSWRLCPEIFQGLLRLFPWLRVHLFADGLNHQLQRYWSRRPDPHAEGVDALTTVWKGMGAYDFPPFRLILRILRKVQNEGATLLLVAPVWH